MIICDAYHIICHEKKSLPLIRKLQKHFYEWSVCYDFQGLSDVSLPANHFSKNWLSQSCREIVVCICVCVVCVCEYL